MEDIKTTADTVIVRTTNRIMGIPVITANLTEDMVLTEISSIQFKSC